MKPLRNRRGACKAFTLVELLVVVLVLAILMAVALPLYLGAVADSQTKTCRANLQTIANAEAAFKTHDPSHAYTTNMANLAANLGATPMCPTGGTYSVKTDGTVKAQGSAVPPAAANGATPPAGAIVVICSQHGNFAPGYDSQ